MCSYAKPFEGENLTTYPPIEGGNITTNPPQSTTNSPESTTTPQELTTNSTVLTTNTPETTTATLLTTNTPQTTTAVTNISEPIPIYEKICIIAAIKQNFYSALGNEYCVQICQGKPMSACNLYICYCVTEEKLKKCLA